MAEYEILNYALPKSTCHQSVVADLIAYYAVYAGGIVAGYMFEEAIEMAMRGQPGDQGVLSLHLAGAVLNGILLAVAYAVVFRKLRSPVRLMIAAGVGLLSFWIMLALFMVLSIFFRF